MFTAHKLGKNLFELSTFNFPLIFSAINLICRKLVTGQIY